HESAGDGRTAQPAPYPVVAGRSLRAEPEIAVDDLELAGIASRRGGRAAVGSVRHLERDGAVQLRAVRGTRGSNRNSGALAGGGRRDTRHAREAHASLGDVVG